MNEVTERCATGITGFDQITQGGFVRNSSNVIIGGPGSGKTTFLLQFLWNGSTQFNENGIYASFEPDIVETLRDALTFGWDFSKLNEQGKVKFLRFSPRTAIDDLKVELTKIISQNQIKRICFDPVSVFALNENDSGKIRENIFDLVSLLKRFKVTSVLSDEFLEEDITQAETGIWSKTDILKFLTDSVTTFYQTGFKQGLDRSLKITKMRRTNHIRNPVGMQITSQGVQVLQ